MSWRVGRLVEVDFARAAVRVELRDDDGIVTGWLPVLQGATLGDRFWQMPDLETQVVCLLDERAEFGVVLGAIYSASDPAPASSGDVVRLRFKDGTEIDYNRASHQLRVAVAAGGSVHVSASSVLLEVPDGGSVQIGGEGGKQLLTTSWAQSVFASHKHRETDPPPLLGAGDLSYPNATERTTAR